jgi:hypothetical protein
LHDDSPSVAFIDVGDFNGAPEPCENVVAMQLAEPTLRELRRRPLVILPRWYSGC